MKATPETILTWKQASERVFDASGIQHPENFTWYLHEGIAYPYEEIKQATPPQKVSIKLTWSGMLKSCLTIYEDGNVEGRKLALQELEKMAKVADLYVKAVEENRIENGLIEKEA